MKQSKRLIASLLSVVLAFSLGGVGVYAIADSPSATQEFAETVEDSAYEFFSVEDMGSVQAGSTADALFDDGIQDAMADEGDSSDNHAGDGISETIDDRETADVADDAEEDGEEVSSAEDEIAADQVIGSDDEDSASPTALPFASLGFVYVDEPVLMVGEEQSIVVSFADDSLAMDDATLFVARHGSTEVASVDASALAGPAALFEMSPANESDAGSYYLSGVQYHCDGQLYYLDLGQSDFGVLDVVEGDAVAVLDDEVSVADVAAPEEAAGIDSGSALYGFEVVTQDEVNVVGESMDNIDGDAVLAFDGEDGVFVADSIEEAIDAIDVEEASQTDESDAQAFDIADLLGVEQAHAAVDGNLVVAIDPGHGGSDSGAVGNGLKEKDVNLSIAKYLRDELRTYSKVVPYMTREFDVYVSLSDRVQKAVENQADVFVCVHVNSGSITAAGAEVWVPNNSVYYKAETADVARSLGSKILAQITSLGLKNRGVKTRNTENDNRYPDGSIADYYTVIQQCRRYKIPALIIEHAFISNGGDAVTYLASETARKKLGVADATGIAQQYGLKKGQATTVASTASKNDILYQAHVQNVGWQLVMRNGLTAGTTGRALRVEGLKVSLDNPKYPGGVQVRSHVQNIGWQNWVSNGGLSGTSGRSLRVEAIQIRLTGEMASHYDVVYRTHVQNVGWQPWVKNGATAGTTGRALRIEAIEIKLQEKSASASSASSVAPAPTNTGSLSGKYVTYQTHVQNVGWQGSKNDGALSGTTGRSLRLEAIQITLGKAAGYSGGIQYRTHIQNVGWESNWKSDGAVSGTTGRALRLEAIQIRLTGEMASRYDVVYRTHVQNVGWQPWVKNGVTAGTTGRALRIEAIEIKLQEKQKVPIMGTAASSASVNQMVKFFNSKGKKYPSDVYGLKGAPTINAFAEIVWKEALAEGVRPDVVFCQAMWETGWLQFGGDVKPEQCNFAGIGAVGGGAQGQYFDSVELGIRAQVQHLKAYASKAALVNPCVDPRFALVSRGVAPHLSDLNGRWAVPGDGYGQHIGLLIEGCRAS